MNEPKVVYCDAHHIYDSSIHSECPYCKELLNKNKDLIKNDKSSDNDVTEYISDVANNSDNTETEYIMPNDTNDIKTEFIMPEELPVIIDTDVDVSDSRLLIDLGEHTEEPDVCSKTHRNLLGWVVIKNGTQRGQSIEILEGENILCSNGTELSIVYSEDQLNDNMHKLAKICCVEKELFALQPYENISFAFEGVKCEESTNIHNYSLICIDDYKFLFVALIRDFVDW